MVHDRQFAVSGWCMVGAGGHARAVADVLARVGHTVACVADPEGQWRDPAAARVRTEDDALDWAVEHQCPVVVAVGDNRARLRIVEVARSHGLALPPVVATTATLSPEAIVGPGVVVMEHAHVGPYAELGAAALVNTAAVVEHDCAVGPAAHIAPGAVMLGGTSVGARALLGARAVVLIGRGVGEDATVGAGAVVTMDVPAGVTAVGMPATPASGSMPR